MIIIQLDCFSESARTVFKTVDKKEMIDKSSKAVTDF